MKMTALKWTLVCGALNATAVVVVALLASLTDLSESVSLAVGASFVVASVFPFTKAQKADAAEKAMAGTPSA
ncbi:MAG: hypothetical protein ACYCW7_11770 [Pseudomonadaceae bacterium]